MYVCMYVCVCSPVERSNRHGYDTHSRDYSCDVFHVVLHTTNAAVPSWCVLWCVVVSVPVFLFVLDLAQLRQARSDANASKEQVPMEVLPRTHEFVHAVDDLKGFWSVHKDQPPVLLLFRFILSQCHVPFGLSPRLHPRMRNTCSRSGSFSGVDGARRANWLRTGGVPGAGTGAFEVLSAALKSPCTSKYRTLHSRVRRILLRILGVRVQTTIAYHNMRVAKNEFPLVQAGAGLVLDHDSLLIFLSRSS